MAARAPAHRAMKSIIISRFLKDIMTRTDIRDVLSRQFPDGSDVVVWGWLRSVRTSKGGFAFLSVNDGSSFDGLQVVAAAALPNYESEIVKLTTGSDLRLTPYHFHHQQMRKVDIVLERDGDMIAGIEIKASATVKASDFSGLRSLSQACGDRFASGIVLYDGQI